MRERYVGRSFDRFRDRDSGRTFENLEFEDCEFLDTALSITLEPARRSTVRDVTLLSCKVGRAATLRSAIVEECLIDGLDIQRGVHTAGAVYRHVTLKGRVGPLTLTSRVLHEAAQPLFDAANEQYYKAVDWALDISRAVFTDEVELKGVPGHLVVRDPVSQVLVTRERASSVRWDRMDLRPTAWDVGLDELLESTLDARVFAACKGSTDYEKQLRVVELFKESGLAEPDDAGLTA